MLPNTCGINTSKIFNLILKLTELNFIKLEPELTSKKCDGIRIYSVRKTSLATLSVFMLVSILDVCS